MGQLSCYRKETVDCMTMESGLTPPAGKRNSSYPNHADHLWGPTSLKFKGYQG